MKILLTLILGLSLAFSLISAKPTAPNADNIFLDVHNTVNLRGEISEASVTETQMELARLVRQRGTQKYNLYLVLDTPGGSIDAGNMFIQYAKTIPNLKTITISAASMGTAIANHLPGERLIISTGVSMFHRAAAGLSGQVEDGELESRLALIKALVRYMELGNATRIGITLEDYKKKVVNEWWIFGEDNIKQKTADRVVNIICSDRLIEDTSMVSFLNIFNMQVTNKTSRCPLIRGGL